MQMRKPIAGMHGCGRENCLAASTGSAQLLMAVHHTVKQMYGDAVARDVERLRYHN
jgi:hypothetical protein